MPAPAEVELYRSETANYRDNLASGAPMLWVALRATGVEPPYGIIAVTADPSEGEGYDRGRQRPRRGGADAGAGARVIEAFVAEHHVERPFYKRKRDRADPEALGAAGPRAKGRE